MNGLSLHKEDTGSISFPAIRGIQAKHEFYVAMIPFRNISRLFIFNEYEVPAEMRAQRILNKARVPIIADYVINNSESYVFSALTSSIDGNMEFIPTHKKSNLGELKISLSAKLIINDGQHRQAAIEKVISERPDLIYETIPVVFFVDKGLERCQQMFADLNKNAVRPSRSLAILYNVRDSYSREVLKIINNVILFHGKIELEKTSISKRSAKLFTLSGLYSASLHTLKSTKDAEELAQRTDFLIDYWTYLSEIIKPWSDVLSSNLPTWQFREDFVCSHGILLEVFGMILKLLLGKQNWQQEIKGLSDIDWLKSNLDWEGKAMINGKMSKTPANVELTYKFLCQKLGLGN
jgi:DNA sulfur modification protein DndB